MIFQYSHNHVECALLANVQCIKYIEERPVTATALSCRSCDRPAESQRRRQPKIVHTVAAEKFVWRRRESAAIEKHHHRRTFCRSLFFPTLV